MIESTQILLFAVVMILTVLLIILGIKLYQILCEIHKALVRFNNTVNNISGFTHNFGQSVKNFSGFSEGIKAAFLFLNLFKKGEKKDGKQS
jgi:hypothetical protein